MTEVFSINQALIFLIDIIGIYLAFWVYWANKKTRINQLFFILTVIILFGVTFAYLGSASKLLGRALIWYRLNLGFVALFFIPAYFFALNFPKPYKTPLFINLLVIFTISIIFLLSVFTNLFAQNAEIKEWGTSFVFGQGKNFYYGVISFLIFLILGILLRKYFTLSFFEKLKIQYFLIGAFIFAFMNFIFNIVLPYIGYGIRFQHLGDYSVIFPLGFTAYAIVKQELFGIKVILTQALVVVVAILLLAQALVSETWLDFSWKFALLLFFLFFGYFLVQSVIREIKRREQIEELSLQLRAANIELDRLSRAKSEFISIASHQLRTPLTAIKGYISMILEGSYGKFSERAKTPMENVYKSNERLINLVNNLLNISRIESGKMEFEPQISSTEEIIESVVAELKITAEKKKLYLKWEKAKTPLPKLLLDQDKMRQVILNLVDNAIKYTEKGGITIKAGAENGKCRVEISDTGEGMEKEELAKIFESFSRGMVGTKLYTEGAGLGLYIARKFVEMHGGKVWAESEGKSKGSTFNIELPIK